MLFLPGLVGNLFSCGCPRQSASHETGVWGQRELDISYISDVENQPEKDFSSKNSV